MGEGQCQFYCGLLVNGTATAVPEPDSIDPHPDYLTPLSSLSLVLYVLWVFWGHLCIGTVQDEFEAD